MPCGPGNVQLAARLSHCALSYSGPPARPCPGPACQNDCDTGSLFLDITLDRHGAPRGRTASRRLARGFLKLFWRGPLFRLPELLTQR